MSTDEPNYLIVYRKRWQALVETDGQLDRDKVARELFDYGVALDEVSKVYDDLTCGFFSKLNIDAQAVIDRVREIQQRDIDEAVREALEESRAQVEDCLRDLRHADETRTAAQRLATAETLRRLEAETKLTEIATGTA